MFCGVRNFRTTLRSYSVSLYGTHNIVRDGGDPTAVARSMLDGLSKRVGGGQFKHMLAQDASPALVSDTLMLQHLTGGVFGCSGCQHPSILGSVYRAVLDLSPSFDAWKALIACLQKTRLPVTCHCTRCVTLIICLTLATMEVHRTLEVTRVSRTLPRTCEFEPRELKARLSAVRLRRRFYL